MSLEALYHTTPAKQDFGTEDYKGKTATNLSMELGIRHKEQGIRNTSILKQSELCHTYRQQDISSKLRVEMENTHLIEQSP